MQHQKITNLQKFHDKRLWAILILGAIVLVSGGRWQVSRIPVSPTNMALYVDGDNLKWVSGMNVTNDGATPAAMAEFTPFFFAPVLVNSASREILMTLPGVGQGMATRIISFRETNGPIKNAEHFIQIQGIGPKKLKELRNVISFE